MINKLKFQIKRHIISERFNYAFVICSLFIGIITGIIASLKAVNIPSYADSVLFVYKLHGVPSFGVFLKSFIDNTRMFFLIWISGYFFILIPLNLIQVAAKGFSLSYGFTYLLFVFGLKGAFFSAFHIIIEFLTILPAVIVFSEMQIKNSIIRKKGKNFKNELSVKAFFKNFLIFLVFLTVPALCGVIDGYVIPVILKIFL